MKCTWPVLKLTRMQKHKTRLNKKIMWCLRANSSFLYDHFMVNRVQNLFTKSTWRSAQWTSSTAKLKRGVWVVDKSFIWWNFAVNFWNFQKFPWRYRSDQVLCGSCIKLIPVDWEAKKKLHDVNKYWILATSRKKYSPRPLCAPSFTDCNQDNTVQGWQRNKDCTC